MNQQTNGSITSDATTFEDIWVRAATPLNNESTKLSPLDNRIIPLYCPSLSAFSLSSQDNGQISLRHLQVGLSQLLVQIPFLAGRLEDDGKGKLPKPDMLISVREDSAVLFRVRDMSLTGSPLGTYKDLKARNFPVTYLQPDGLLAPPMGRNSNGPFSGPGDPVFVTQATIIDGGLLLVYAFVHPAGDILLMQTIQRLWADNTRRAAVNELNRIPEMLSANFFDRSTIAVADNQSSPADEMLVNYRSIPMTDAIKAAEMVLRYDAKKTPPPRDTHHHACWYISAEKLVSLKELATRVGTKNGEWISTFDAVSAFLWYMQYKFQKRSEEISQESQDSEKTSHQSKMVVPLDVRTRLDPPLPREYLGMAVGTFTVFATSEDLDNPLPEALKALAKQIRQANRDYDATEWTHVARKNELLSPDSYLVFKEPDMFANNYCDNERYNLNWGRELGQADCIRQPSVVMLRGKPQFRVLPKLRNGGWEVIVTTEVPTLEAMKSDAEFTFFATLLYETDNHGNDILHDILNPGF